MEAPQKWVKARPGRHEETEEPQGQWDNKTEERNGKTSSLHWRRAGKWQCKDRKWERNAESWVRQQERKHGEERTRQGKDGERHRNEETKWPNTQKDVIHEGKRHKPSMMLLVSFEILIRTCSQTPPWFLKQKMCQVQQQHQVLYQPHSEKTCLRAANALWG